MTLESIVQTDAHRATGTGTRALIQDRDGRWMQFHDPARILRADTLEDVERVISQAEEAASAGLYAAGFVSYEAAAAFDPAMKTKAECPVPFAWFGIYERAERVHSSKFQVPSSMEYKSLRWEASVGADAYGDAIARIKEYIAAGDTYQVNYSYRLRSPFEGDPMDLFHALGGPQRGQYTAYIDTGDHAVCSISPELFFRLDGDEIVCKPMKGTTPRGLTTREDRERASWLQHSTKNRAENVMIVDMVRNDLGRIAATGTVRTHKLFEVEKYETLFQLTSKVCATTDAPITEIFRAMFPCASVTGAPKIRTMGIIDELESAPRGIYTGCVGFMSPDRKAQFNVAIRTVHVNRADSIAEYGTGGGVVWDSSTENEYEECRTKALILRTPSAPLDLLETLLWKPGEGYYLLQRHLDRLVGSAEYFDIPLQPEAIIGRLDGAAAHFDAETRRVRLLVSQEGEIRIESTRLDVEAPVPGAMPPRTAAATRVALATRPIDRDDRFLYHKTTRRDVYDDARVDHPDMDDVLLWNTQREVTEFTYGNVVVQFGHEYVTPPVRCGLLAGTMRDELLEKGEITERVVTLDDLQKADACFFINSVRGRLPCNLDTTCSSATEGRSS